MSDLVSAWMCWARIVRASTRALLLWIRMCCELEGARVEALVARTGIEEAPGPILVSPYPKIYPKIFRKKPGLGAGTSSSTTSF